MKLVDDGRGAGVKQVGNGPGAGAGVQQVDNDCGASVTLVENHGAVSAAPCSMAGLRIGLVGPLPPPSGGMANQTLQLASLLGGAGASVRLLPVNRPHRPAWLARLRGVRAGVRLLAYLWSLWRLCGKVDLLHLMANSGWSWHLHAAPAIWVAWLRGTPVLLNYRGGEADAFLLRRQRWVGYSLRRVAALVVPSGYLVDVFSKYGYAARIVPNIIDLQRFRPQPASRPHVAAPLVLVARNLEAIYDNASALRAFAIVLRRYPLAQLVLAGSGPELPALQLLAGQLGLLGAVRFAGHVDNADMAPLYQSCSVVLNPSLADNMPNSVLEALACAAPLVSTNVGGIPALLRHNSTALLVAPGDYIAMAQALLLLLGDTGLARRLANAGSAMVRQYHWPAVAPLLLAQYRSAMGRHRRSLYTLLVATVLFPLQEFLKRHTTLTVRRAMEVRQWQALAGLEALQLARLRALLLHAQQHVPYYRALFAEYAFDPASCQCVADLQRLPLLRKADIARNTDAFRSDVARDLARFSTGGSSGEPLVFFIGKERVSHDVAAKWRATRWWGVDIGDVEAVVWGSPIELAAQDRWRRVRDGVMRTHLLPAFAMSAAHLDADLARLRRLRPRMLFGYPSALNRLAEHAERHGVAMHQLGIRVTFVTSERLYDSQRARISRVFGCPVANGYGGRDAGFIAHECPEGGLHITAEDVIVDIVDPDGHSVPRGSSGAIVVTHLATADFPFIRYATGDIGALAVAPCPCGRTLPLLERLDGRSTDFVVAQDGSVLHGLALIYILRELSEVRQFKIVQESLLLIRVALVATAPLPEPARAAIVAGFRARLGASVAVLIEQVAEIEPEASGKFRYVISKVAPPT